MLPPPRKNLVTQVHTMHEAKYRNPHYGVDINQNVV